MTKFLKIGGVVLAIIAVIFILVKQGKVIETSKLKEVEDKKTTELLKAEINTLKTQKAEIEKKLKSSIKEARNIKETTEKTFDKDGKIATEKTTKEDLSKVVTKTDAEEKAKVEETVKKEEKKESEKVEAAKIVTDLKTSKETNNSVLGLWVGVGFNNPLSMTGVLNYNNYQFMTALEILHNFSFQLTYQKTAGAADSVGFYLAVKIL